MVSTITDKIAPPHVVSQKYLIFPFAGGNMFAADLKVGDRFRIVGDKPYPIYTTVAVKPEDDYVIGFNLILNQRIHLSTNQKVMRESNEN